MSSSWPPAPRWDPARDSRKARPKANPTSLPCGGGALACVVNVQRDWHIGPKAFREFAQECVRWAEDTKDERQRQVLLDLAKRRMQAAMAVESSIVSIDDDTPLVPTGDNPR